MAKRKTVRRRSAVHTRKWDRCVDEVLRKGGAVSPQAVCTSRLGERGSILKRHRRRSNPRRLSKRDRLRAAVGALSGRPRWIVTDSHGNERLANPRPAALVRARERYWIIIAVHRGLKPHASILVYQGDRFAREVVGNGEQWRKAVKFPSESLARQFARFLTREHAQKLRGWRLRVVGSR